jgi:hypothetical protein
LGEPVRRAENVGAAPAGTGNAAGQPELNSIRIKGLVLVLTDSGTLIKPASCPGNCGWNIPERFIF